MISKKSLWFLTLFSLILVLSIYYITMPSELLLKTNTNNLVDKKTHESQATISVEESDIVVALRVESDEEMANEIEKLQLILTNADSSVNDKNMAYEKIKKLKDNRGDEEKLQEQIKQTYNLNSFIKIKDNQISVTINSNKHDKTLANNIMRTIQSNYDTSKYITIKFQK